MLPLDPPRESSLQGSAIEIIRNPSLTAELTAQLVDLWAAVTNVGGGAVGFARGVTSEQVRTLANPAFDRVRAGADDLVVAYQDGQPVGMAFLAINELALHAHWGTVKRLQRHPDVRESGVGTALLAGVEEAARARGLERLVLTVRAGTGREGFYAGLGYRMEAVLPGRIRLEGGAVRDELVMSKDLDGGGGATLRVQRLDRDLPLPAYAHPGDAGLDLYAAADITLQPGERAVIGTGIAVALPTGCVGLVHPRSGLAARSGLGLVNAPGTIDEGYRGEIKVIAINLDTASPLHLSRGERVAQLVIQRVETVAVTEVQTLDDTSRGAGGFGSSGR